MLQVSRDPILLSDSDVSGSAGADSDFVASDSEDEAADTEADSPVPVKRAYQTHVKNRALAGDVEIVEEEAQEDKYQHGKSVVPACTRAAGICGLVLTRAAGARCKEVWGLQSVSCLVESSCSSSVYRLLQSWWWTSGGLQQRPRLCVGL